MVSVLPALLQTTNMLHNFFQILLTFLNSIKYTGSAQYCKYKNRLLLTLSRSTWKQHAFSSRTLKKMVPWRMSACFSTLPMIQRKILFWLVLFISRKFKLILLNQDLHIYLISVSRSISPRHADMLLVLAILTDTAFKFVSAVLSVSSHLAWHWLQQSSWHTSVKTMYWLFLQTWALTLRLCERYVSAVFYQSSVHWVWISGRVWLWWRGNVKCWG